MPFLDHDAEIMKITCTARAIESLSARYRRAVHAPRALPDRASVMHGRSDTCLRSASREIPVTPGPSKHAPGIETTEIPHLSQSMIMLS